MTVASAMGKVLLLLGGAIAAVGVVLLLGGRWFERGGRLLPGDLLWRRGDVSLYLPLGTCLVASVVLSLLLTVALHIVGHWRQ